jgi:hypothetical protein
MILEQPQKAVRAAERLICECQRTWFADRALTFSGVDRLLNLPAGTWRTLHDANERSRSLPGAACEIVERLGADAVIAMLGGIPNG